MQPDTTPDLEELTKRVLPLLEACSVQPSGCWRSKIRTSERGYARVAINGRRYALHRLAYVYKRGSIPNGLELDHLCRNRWCVNPEHLEPVTHRENVIRGVGPSAVNARKQKCVNGHALDGRLKRGDRACMECHRIHCRRYRADNAAKARDAGRARYMRSRERVLARQRARRAANADQVRAYDRERYWANRSEILARRKAAKEGRAS